MGGAWKIAQYNLTVPIPNDLLAGFAEKIREFTKKPSPAGNPASKPTDKQGEKPPEKKK